MKRIIVLLFVGVLCVALLSSFNTYEVRVPKAVVFFAFLFSFLFFLYQEKSAFKGMWHKPSNIFLFCYLIVSFQYVIDLCLGYKTYQDFYVPSSVNKMSLTCLCGLISFILGYVMTGTGNHDKQQSEADVKLINISFLVFLQVAFFVGWILTVNILALLSGIGYFVDDSGSAASNYENFFYDVTIAIFIAIITNSKRKDVSTLKSFLKEGTIIIWTLICIYCLIRLVSGDRGPALYMASAVFFTYMMVTRKKIKVGKIIIVILFGALVLNMVGMARSMSLNMSFSERVMTAFTEFSSSSESRFSDKTISPLTEELAMSNRCNQIAIDLIDNGSDDYHYGKYTFYQTIQCFPFVSSYLAHTLKIPEDELSANIKMTDVYHGSHEYSQIGTTVVADPYFDFGIIGVTLMLLLCGWVFKKVDSGVCLDTPSNWVQIAIVLLFASMAIYIPRSTLIIQLKQLIPISVFYYINLIFFCKR